MTAHARRADLANLLHRAVTKLDVVRRVCLEARRPVYGFAVAGCIVARSLALGQESLIIENLAVPAPSLGGSFEDPSGDYDSVLVDDGTEAGLGRAPAASGQIQNYNGFDGGPQPNPAVSPFEREAGGQNTPVIDAERFAGDWWTDCTSAIAQGVNWLPGGCEQHGHRGRGHACGPDGRCGPCHDACGGGLCHGGCRPGCLWAIQADALVLWRNNIDGQPLLLDDTGAVVLDAGDVRTAAAAGPRIGLLRNLGCGRAVEVSYFNVGGIQGSTATGAVGGPYTPIGLADLAFADIEEAQYSTRGQIKSAEFNYRWCQGRRVIWLAGFRWVEWNEVGTVEMQPAEDWIQARAGNDLYGGQFGCRLRIWDLGKWQFTGVGKVGVFSNTSYQRTAADVGGDMFGPLGADDTSVAFFGEVGANSTLWLTEWLAWRVGYNFFWLQGVATAPQQFSLVNYGSDSASINTDGSVFLQGFSTGLEARW